ncbi:MAG: PEP/pyruvate-binding domain-containing protein [Stackebrandtia sp.]
MAGAQRIPDIVDLDSVGAEAADLVGGKAANLGEMIAAGMAVPQGFCVTTRGYGEAVDVDDVAEELERTPAEDATRLTRLAEAARNKILQTPVPDSLRAAIVTRYERLGADGPVAIRSSATAEDLPHASFAGQLDSYLNIAGGDAVVDAVRRCWASLWTERAVHYRAANDLGHSGIGVAVVVQSMVDAQVAGVLFTANPITGRRTQMVVDAAPGLGDALVSGAITPDHYLLDDESPHSDGCLSAARLEEIRVLGRRLEDHFGSPQDAEWAVDADGKLWLTQSRPITTLFPLPKTSRPGVRAFLSVSAAQGVLQPLTPMGMSVMRMSGAAMWNEAGLKADPIDGLEGFVDAGGRMYADLTKMLRSKRTRKNLPEQMQIYGPRVTRSVTRLLDDPRFTPQGGMPIRMSSALKVGARYTIPALTGVARALLRPAAARARAQRMAERIEQNTTAPTEATTAERLRFVEGVSRKIMGREMMDVVWVLFAAGIAVLAPPKLLGRFAEESELLAVLRGMPHNVTTEMDLRLWRTAVALEAHRELLQDAPPDELAARFREGTLPSPLAEAVSEFLEAYGRRAAAEIDVGVPRWSEEPAPVFAALANYLRVDDPRHAPDRRFQTAAAEAEATIDALYARARRRRPLRARLARFYLRRARELSGLRELPKFASLHGYGQIREQLLLIGDALTRQGVLDRADDVMFLDVREARAAVDGVDLRGLIGRRRVVHEREMRRRYVPMVLLSDGTDPETEVAPVAAADGVLVGMAAAPGKVTGAARVVRDPNGARLEPGEILVAPSTDPGWTPLFLTAGGLVTETGAANSHGPTVAREYGIPAVIGVPAATERIRTGQIITVDAYAGTVAFASVSARPSEDG